MAQADLVPSEPAPWPSFVQRCAEGKIPFQHCQACGENFFYPRVLCPGCGSVELTWQESTGRGTIYSQTFVPGRDGGGYHVILVDLAEGFRVMASVADDTLDYPIGAAVVGHAEVEPENPEKDPRFVFEKVQN